MDVVGQVFGSLALLLFLLTVLYVIPVKIGMDSGFRIVGKHFPSWPKVRLLEAGVFGFVVFMFVLFAQIALLVVVYGVWPTDILELVLARQQKEVQDAVLYVIQAVIIFFVAGFITTLFTCWFDSTRMSKYSADKVQSKPPGAVVVLAKGFGYSYYLSLFLILIWFDVRRHTVGELSDAALSYMLYAVPLISILSGAAYVTKRLDVKGWLYGGSFGLIYLAGLLVIDFGVVIHDDFRHTVGSMALMAFVVFSTGIAGGILGRLTSSLNRNTS